MEFFPCSYLGSEVELTAERELHIAAHHPDLLPSNKRHIIETINHPDQVRRSSRAGDARLFSRWYPELKGGKHVVVVVMGAAEKSGHSWIITAYMASKLAPGEIEWQKS